MNRRPSPLLDDSSLEGTITVERALAPPLAARLITEGMDGAERAIRGACQMWGGASHLLLPATLDGEKYVIDDDWRQVDSGLKPDRYLLHDEYASAEQIEGCFDDTPNGQGLPPSVVGVLAAFGRKKDDLANLIVPVLKDDDPWKVSYLGTFGSWQAKPGKLYTQFLGLDPDVSYDAFINQEFQEVSGSAVDVAERIRMFGGYSPAAISLLSLGARPAARRDPFFQSDIVPDRHKLASEVGPNIVVVYEPGSVEDLILLWNLRAANAHSRGLPLAIPNTENVAAVVEKWMEEGFFRVWGFSGGGHQLLVSRSVQRGTLDEIAKSINWGTWSACDWQEVARAGEPPALYGTDLISVHAGEAQMQKWSPADSQLFAEGFIEFEGAMNLRTRPMNEYMPEIDVLAKENLLSETKFRFGCHDTSGGNERRKPTTSFRWPSGWATLEAAARDKGLKIERSSAGLAAEAFLAQLKSLSEVSMLLHPAAIELLHELGEASGISHFRKKARELGSAVFGADDDERAAALEAAIADIAQQPYDDVDGDRKDLNTIKQRLGCSKEGATTWLAWAESRGLVVKGVTIRCDKCFAESWRTVTEMAPPIPCRGCGRDITNPYPQDGVNFSYRGSYVLHRVLEHDVLSHLIAVYWLATIFGGRFNRPGLIYGYHPGVNFYRDKELLGEADVVMLTHDGDFILGECKRNPYGLKPEEVQKLDLLCEALRAPWSFLSTPHPAGDCPDLWKASIRELPDAPRFVLTAEHLFSHPLKSNDFSWKQDSEELEKNKAEFVERLPQQSRWLNEQEMRIDSDLHTLWEYFDKNP